MSLCLHNVSSLIEKDVVTVDEGGQSIQDRLRGQVDLIQKDPLSLLYALDQCPLDELEDKAAAILKLLSTLGDFSHHIF